MNEGVSVIVCCFNSSNRLPVTLEHLANQQVPDTIKWEIVIVDNGSTDNTAVLANKEWEKYRNNIPFRIVRQPVPGQSAARDKGYEEAQYECLLYVDDDNWLKPNYIALAYEIMQQQQQIGILGGQCTAAFETEPPSWFYKKSSVFAIGKQGTESGPISSYGKYLFGAACVIRKSAWANLREHQFRFLTKGRTGAQLSGGDDVELNKAIRLLGYKLWYDERLEFTHFMPTSRLGWEYLVRIGKGSASSGLPLLVYDFFLQDGNLTYARFKWLYVKLTLRRLLVLLTSIAPVVRSFTIKNREGDLTAFDAMRSRVLLQRLVTSFNEAKRYYQQIKSIRTGNEQ